MQKIREYLSVLPWFFSIHPKNILFCSNVKRQKWEKIDFLHCFEKTFLGGNFRKEHINIALGSVLSWKEEEEESEEEEEAEEEKEEVAMA